MCFVARKVCEVGTSQREYTDQIVVKRLQADWFLEAHIIGLEHDLVL